MGLHVYGEDCDVDSHAKEDKPTERLVGRQPEIKGEEGKLDGKVNEVVVYLFDEEDLKNLDLLRLVDRPYMSLHSLSDCVGYTRSNFVLTVRILHGETDVELPADHSSLPIVPVSGIFACSQVDQLTATKSAILSSIPQALSMKPLQ